MAVTKEFLQGINEAITEDQIGLILKEYDQDLTGIKLNRDAVLGENRGYKEKLEKAAQEREAEKAETLKKIEELEQQLKANGSEELKAHYEGKLEDLTKMYAGKLSEAEKAALAGKAEYDNLYGEYLQVLRNTELDRAMDKHPNIIPEMKDILRVYFWGKNQFDLTELEGKKRLLNPNDNYRSIEDTLAAFIGTEEGKRFVMANGTGGGATGNASTKSNIKNPWAKDAENLTEQMRIAKENPQLAESLKAQAGK